MRTSQIEKLYSFKVATKKVFLFVKVICTYILSKRSIKNYVRKKGLGNSIKVYFNSRIVQNEAIVKLSLNSDSIDSVKSVLEEYASCHTLKGDHFFIAYSRLLKPSSTHSSSSKIDSTKLRTALTYVEKVSAPTYNLLILEPVCAARSINHS